MDRTATQAASKGERRRLEVLSLARRQVLESGLERLTLRSLAEALGMTLGNLQYYFPSRDDLLEAILRSEAATDLEAFRSVVASGSDGSADPAEDLRTAVVALAGRWYALNGSVYLPIAVRAIHDARFVDVIREIWESFYAELTPLVRRLDLTASPTEARSRAMLIVMLLDGSSIQSYAASGRLSRPAMTAELARTAVQIARGS
jgi:AcrR family transcriptional regulator